MITTWIISILIVFAIGWPVGKYLRRRIDRNWSRRGFHTPEAIADFKREWRWMYEYEQAYQRNPPVFNLRTREQLKRIWKKNYPNEPWPGSR